MENNQKNLNLIPRILSAFDIICFVYIIFLMLVLVLNDFLHEIDSPGSFTLLAFILLAIYKYHIVRYIYKNNISFATSFSFKQETTISIILSSFIFTFLIMLFMNSTQSWGILLYFILLMLSNIRWMVIVPEGILINQGFFAWEKIKEVKWSQDGHDVIIYIEKHPLNLFGWTKYQYFIHPEKREQLNQAIINHFGAPIKSEEAYTAQHSST